MIAGSPRNVFGCSRNNAGHTVVIDGEAFAFHLLPAGVLTPGVTPMIGNGVVVDLEVLFSEIAEIEARGRDASSFCFSKINIFIAALLDGLYALLCICCS